MHKKRPQSVLVVIASKDGWVLMLERTSPPGLWQSVTGSLQWGESPRQAALRELYEETGFQAGSQLLDLQQTRRFRISPAWRHRYAVHARYNQEHWFLLRLPRRRAPRLNPSEHVRWRWVKPARAARLAFSWSNREAIERYAA